MILNKALFKRIIAYFAFILVAILSPAQEINDLISDSVKYQPIQLSEIPIELAETIAQGKEILDDLISNEEIEKLKQKNDSILNIVEKSEALIKKEMSQTSIRFLQNRLLQLQSQKIIVDAEVEKLTGIIKDLSRSMQFFNDEKIIWTNTKEKILELDYLETITKRIDQTINLLDSANSNVAEQAEIMLLTLDRSSQVSIKIEFMIADLNDAIKSQEMKLLESKYPNIFNLNYSSENIKIDYSFAKYAKSEWTEIKAFIARKADLFVIIGFLFIVLLTMFFYYQKRFEKEAKSIHNYYQKRLILVLTKPVSASVLLAILITILILPDLPLIIRDLLSIFLVIPLLVIMRQLLDKKLLYTIYGFAIIMILNILLEIFSPENIIYRIYLLFMAIANIILIRHFIFRILKNLHYEKKGLILKSIGYVFLVMAFIGLYGAIMGNVVIGKDLLIALNIAVVAGALIYASLIILNGIIITIIDAKYVSRINFFRNRNAYIKKKVVRILNFLGGFYFLVILLKQLNVWFSIRDRVADLFTEELSILDIEFSLTSVLVFILIIYLSVLISKTIQIILEYDVFSKIPMDKGLPHSISMIVKYSIITGGILLAVSAAGMPLTSLTVLLGAFGVGIGFGLQNIFNNLVSGLILLFERPVQIGDTIEVGTLIGTVRSIGIRASNIKTFDGAEVIVPNGQLISNEVINWTLSDQQRRIEVIVGVSYDSDPHQVYKLIMNVLTQRKDIMQDPAPTVLFNEMGESSLDFRLLFWTTSFSKWLQIRSEVIFEIFDLLKENNIEIPFPQRDVHIRSIEEQLKIDNSKNKD